MEEATLLASSTSNICQRLDSCKNILCNLGILKNSKVSLYQGFYLEILQVLVEYESVTQPFILPKSILKIQLFFYQTLSFSLIMKVHDYIQLDKIDVND